MLRLFVKEILVVLDVCIRKVRGRGRRGSFYPLSFAGEKHVSVNVFLSGVEGG